MSGPEGARRVRSALAGAWGSEPFEDDPAGRDSGCEDEYAYVSRFFRGKRWTDVDLSSLRSGYPGPHDACLSFMGPEAFRYFLASYMAIALDEPDVPDSAVDAATAALVPPRYRPEVDAIARRELARAAAADPDLDAEALLGSRATSPGSARALRAWWEERVAGFTDAQRAAIVAFLEHVASTGDPAAAEALEWWRPEVAAGGDEPGRPDRVP